MYLESGKLESSRGVKLVGIESVLHDLMLGMRALWKLQTQGTSCYHGAWDVTEFNTYPKSSQISNSETERQPSIKNGLEINWSLLTDKDWQI